MDEVHKVFLQGVRTSIKLLTTVTRKAFDTCNFPNTNFNPSANLYAWHPLIKYNPMIFIVNW
jgi:hypothetical protein